MAPPKDKKQGLLGGKVGGADGAPEGSSAADSQLQQIRKWYADFKRDPVKKKGNPRNDVERLINAATTPADVKAHALRCKARMYFWDAMAAKDADPTTAVSTARSAIRDLVYMPARPGQARSLWAFNLLFQTFLWEAKKTKVYHLAAEFYDNQVVKVATEDWVDPAEEAIDLDPPEEFEKWSGSTKEERVQAVLVRMLKATKAAKSKVKDFEDKNKAGTIDQMAEYASQLQRQQQQQQQQQALPEAQQAEKQLRIKEAEEFYERAKRIADSNETMDKEIEKIVDVLNKKFKGMQPGSEDRVLAMRRLFEQPISAFEQKMREDAAKVTERSRPEFKEYYVRQFNNTFARVRSRGTWLQLHPEPELLKALRCEEQCMLTMAKDAGVSASAAGAASKDGGAAVGKGGKGGSKGGAGKGGEVAAAKLVGEAAAAERTSIPDHVHEWLDGLQAKMRESSSELLGTFTGLPYYGNKMYKPESAKTTIKEFMDGSIKEAGGLNVAEVYNLDYWKAAEGAEGMNMLASEMVQTLQSYFLESQPVQELGQERWQGVEQPEDVLKKYNSVASEAQTWMLAGGVLTTNQDNQVVVAFQKIPPTGNAQAEALPVQRIDDDLGTVLRGYCQLLLHRGKVPLKHEDRKYDPLRVLAHHLVTEDEDNMFVIATESLIHEAFTPEYRMLYGELPATHPVAIRARQAKEAAAKAAAEGDLEAAASTSDPAPAAQGSSAEQPAADTYGFQPMDSELVGEDLEMAKEGWGADVLDTLRCLQQGNLGPVTALAVRTFVACAVSKARQERDPTASAMGYTEVPLEADGEPQLQLLLADLSVKHLLQLRHFLLLVLGDRHRNYNSRIALRLEQWERQVVRTYWGISIESQDGSGEVVRMSMESYQHSAAISSNVRWKRALRETCRKRIVEAKRALAKTPEEEINKRIEESIKAAHAGLPMPYTDEEGCKGMPWDLVPFDAMGGSQLEEDVPAAERKKTAVSLEDRIGAWPLDNFVCMDEQVKWLKAHMQSVHVGDPVQLGTEAAERAVVEDLLGRLDDPNDNFVDSLPQLWTLSDVMHHLCRAAIVAALRRQLQHKVQRAMESLLLLSARHDLLVRPLASEALFPAVQQQAASKDEAMLQRLRDGEPVLPALLAEHLSPVPFVGDMVQSAMEGAREKAGGTDVIGERPLEGIEPSKQYHDAVNDYLRGARNYGQEVQLGMLNMQLAFIRMLLAHYEHLQTTQLEYASQVKREVEQLEQKIKGAEQSSKGSKGKGPKPSDTALQLLKERLTALQHKSGIAEDDKGLLAEVIDPLRKSAAQVEAEMESLRRVWDNPSIYLGGSVHGGPDRFSKRFALPDLPSWSFDQLRKLAGCIQAGVQQLTMADALVEELQSSARSMLHTAVTNWPVLSPGVSAMTWVREWMGNQFKELPGKAHLEELLAEEAAEAEKARLAKAKEEEKKKKKKDKQKENKAAVAATSTTAAEDADEEPEPPAAVAKEGAGAAEAAAEAAAAAKPAGVEVFNDGRVILDMTALMDEPKEATSRTISLPASALHRAGGKQKQQQEEAVGGSKGQARQQQQAGKPGDPKAPAGGAGGVGRKDSSTAPVQASPAPPPPPPQHKGQPVSRDAAMPKLGQQQQQPRAAGPGAQHQQQQPKAAGQAQHGAAGKEGPAAAKGAQQQQQGGRPGAAGSAWTDPRGGQAGAKPAGGGSQKAGQQAQQQPKNSVPGFVPGWEPDSAAKEGEGKRGRKGRKAGEGSIASSAAAAAAQAITVQHHGGGVQRAGTAAQPPSGANTWGAGSHDAAGAWGEQPEMPAGAECPPGFVVYEGVPVQVNTDVEALARQAAIDNDCSMEGPQFDNFRLVFIHSLSELSLAEYHNSQAGVPPPRPQEEQEPLPYAMPAVAPHHEPPHGLPPGMLLPPGMPPAMAHLAHLPAFAGMRPPMAPGLPGAVPLPGMTPYGMPPGMAPPLANAPGPEDEEEDGVDDLMGLLGVAAPVAPVPAPRPHAASVPLASVPLAAPAAAGSSVSAWASGPPAGRTWARAAGGGQHGGPDEADMDLQQVLHESMQVSHNSAFPPLLGAAGGQDTGASVSGTGLVNRTGEYNCFLNVIIQCLWHCEDFRQAIATRKPAESNSHPVVTALVRLFRALDSSHQDWTAGRARHAVDPSELREALDAMPGYQFRVGEMSDPSEVLCALYESMNQHPDLRRGLDGLAGRATLVDSMFGLNMSEEVRCSKCNKISHEVKPHVEYYLIIPATALREMKLAMSFEKPHINMSELIKLFEGQHSKRCDKDPPIRGCNEPMPVTKMLGNTPNVFTMLLSWDVTVSPEDIASTLACVDTILDPEQIFNAGNCPHDLGRYALHGMFCYYGQHYFAFINKGGPLEGEESWFQFDDTSINTVGRWQDVIAKCKLGRIQPSVLFYQRLKP